ncbi:hypothetical protein KSS87_017947 [Heliosperma pusillum]|nr:hypothetical protein KSS87_017947 [Heliosperma pusillum]
MKYNRRKRLEKEEQHPKVVMGGCSEWSQENGFCPNGLVVEEAASINRPLDPGRWTKAEERTAELISRIQPNRPSEKHRNAVASYVQRLVSNRVPCQVFTFGSVPLKTYLPDGDIDLTAFSEDQNIKDNWAEEVQDMLLKEEKNEHAEFQVKEVQLIQAEVRIIKCLVDNIVVDISFNQLGGLCTLCFLEEVDNLISQNHLFKRSIILIKAWCYYESRILGAHHGLISTYALETLVLYIFNVFNNSFAGPLEVLYRFLEFFSKFDWANFCVSLWGPVPIGSLPNMAAAPPRKDGGNLLLSQMFLDACGTAYSVFPAGLENRESRFSSKHLNIIDPLRLNNNLGRSVNKGNFFRIRSAFSLGAQQLAKILKCPVDDIVPELNQFFVNTWDRHGKGCRPDAPISDFISREQEVDEPHHSLSNIMHPDTSSLLPTARTIDSHKDSSFPKQKDHEETRNHMTSGVNHYSTERNKLWKKQHDDIKRTCRMNILQTSGHTTHQFARTSSSPELTNMSSEVSSTYRHNGATEKLNDDTGSRTGYSRRKIDNATTDNHVANCFNDEEPCIRESSSRNSVASGSDNSRQRFVEDQDFVKKLSSFGIQNYGGHAQMPVNLASQSFVPFPPPVMGFNQQNYAGMNPTNLLAVESDWGSMMNYPNSRFPVQFPQQIRPFRVIPEQENMIERLETRAVSPGLDDHVDENSGTWIDGHSNREIDQRSSPASPSASSRTKASSESSWDGKPTKMTNISKYPLGKKVSSARNSSVTVNDRWQEDGEPTHHSFENVNDDRKDWVHLSAAESVTTSHVEVNQIPGFGHPQISCPNSISPFGSVLVHPGSHHGAVHNHAVLPVAFYHAGPPVPFVTMVPSYNLPADTGSSGGPTGHDSEEQGKLTFPTNREQEQLSHTDSYESRNSIASGARSDECGSDIFNSDFASHWKNLQYGRLCQGSQFRHPYAYPPPLPTQGTSNVSPGGSNTFAHVVPVSVYPAGVSRHYGGEVSKQRNGTGTYFPNPNIIKERQSPTPRQYRGGYGHERNENHGDREANRNVYKPRFGGRGQSQNYYEKKNTKIDRSATSISQTDRTWDTFQENSNPLNCLSNCPSPSNSSQHVPDVVDYSVYQVHSEHNDEVSSAGNGLHRLFMLYPYPHPTDYGSWTDNLQFGTVGPERLVGRQVQEFNGYPERGSHELHNFEGDVGRTSPDYASSPRFLR